MNLWSPGSKKSGAAGETEDADYLHEPPLEAGSWEKPRQELPVAPVGDRRVPGAPLNRMVPREKRRRTHMSVCMSDEEEAILREYVASQNMNFSDWARKVLFAAARRKLPSRTRGGEAA